MMNNTRPLPYIKEEMLAILRQHETNEVDPEEPIQQLYEFVHPSDRKESLFDSFLFTMQHIDQLFPKPVFF